MDSVVGIVASTPLTGIDANTAIIQGTRVVRSGSGAVTAGVFGASTWVELSGLGQALSATAAFQDQLGRLQPGTATSGGGQGFGIDLPSLAAEAQSLVDAFNRLQNGVSAFQRSNGFSSATSGLAQGLNAQAQAEFDNGDSALTRLSQIGIVFHPGAVAGSGGSLTVDMDLLEAGFAADPAGAFSLLSQATRGFGEVANRFVEVAGNDLTTLGALGRVSGADQLLGNSFLSPLLGGGFDLAAALALEPLTRGTALGGSNNLQAILAANQFALVSTLLG